MSRTRVGVLASGRGSNLGALIAAAQDPAFPGEIALVISNNPGAAALARAEAAGIDTAIIDHRPFGGDREGHERLIDDALRAAGVQVVVHAGYMRILSPWLVEAWAGRMMNIHPSLLPAFPGLNTHARALEAGVKLHGCTVHLVSEQVDDGPILGQAAVPVLQGDTADTLAARVLAAEHSLYPACLAAFLRGRIDGPSADAVLSNPV